MVSVICPIYNEEKYIAQCIESVLAQDYPQTDLEILFVDGMSSDHTREIVAQYAQHYPQIRIVDNPHRTVPYAMNIGIEEAKGEIVVRLDAHAAFPSNYISTLVKQLLSLPNAHNVGAACVTHTQGKTDKAKAIVAVLSNRFGVGNSTFRLGVTEVQKVDTVPFGCWRKQTLKDVGMFDTRLIRNQDIELNKRILKAGGSIYLVPDTYCIYYARETYSKMAKNNYGNGQWNVLTLYYTQDMRSLSVRHFVPLAFVLSLVLPLLGMIICPWIGLVAALSMLCYSMLIDAISWQIARREHISIFAVITAFITLHMSYGVGSLIGILKLPFIKK
ncbi:MAG: glycosyltransferase family 2 protein [Paludibacteraceae bacterium]|nr:glycosyltransferase family 2 protein [Paludibacteraceae bacterium]